MIFMYGFIPALVGGACPSWSSSRSGVSCIYVVLFVLEALVKMCSWGALSACTHSLGLPSTRSFNISPHPEVQKANMWS